MLRGTQRGTVKGIGLGFLGGTYDFYWILPRKQALGAASSKVVMVSHRIRAAPVSVRLTLKSPSRFAAAMAAVHVLPIRCLHALSELRKRRRLRIAEDSQVPP